MFTQNYCIRHFDKTVFLSQCSNMIQICIKNRSLFDLCINILNKIGYGIQLYYHCFIAHLVFLLFYVSCS